MYNVTLQHVFTYCLYPLGAPNSLIQFHLKTALLWWFNVTGNSKTYLGLHVTSPIFYPILIKFRFFQQIFTNVPKIKFHRNASSRSCTDMHRQMDKQLDIMKLIGAFIQIFKSAYKTDRAHINVCKNYQLKTLGMHKLRESDSTFCKVIILFYK